MKKIAILTSILALTACGGGSGGGGSVIETTNGTNANTSTSYFDSVARSSNINVTSSIDNSAKRNAVVQNNYSAAGIDLPTIDQLHTSLNNTKKPGNARIATQRTSSVLDFTNTAIKNLIDAMYENMNYWLHTSNKKPQTDKEYIQYQHALILAGYVRNNSNEALFSNEQTNNQIKEVIDAISDETLDQISNDANTVYEELGTIHKFDLTKISWFALPETADAKDEITFHIDENEKITGISFVENKDIESREKTLYMNRKDDDNTYTANNIHMYEYSLNNVEMIDEHSYDPMATEDSANGQRIEISSIGQLTTAEIKQKLKAEIELLFTEEYFHSFHGVTEEERNQARAELANEGITDPDWELVQSRAQNIAAQKLKNAAIARVDNWENEENKAVNDYTINLETDLVTYGKNVGLAYSDFGTMNMHVLNEENSDDNTIIYGGQTDKFITKEVVNNNNETMEFNGTAIGTVNSNITANHSGEHISQSPTLDLSSDSAKLTFVPGQNGNLKETLNVSFANNNWYDVEIINDTANGNPTINFTDNTEHGVNEKYKFIGHENSGSSDEYTVHDFTTKTTDFDTNHDGTTGGRSGAFGVQYYGVNNNPTEVVGYAAYQESEPFASDQEQPYNQDRVKNIHFEMGFGLQKDLTK